MLHLVWKWLNIKAFPVIPIEVFNMKNTAQRLIHFDSVRDILQLLTVENFVIHSAAEFLSER